MFTDLGIGMPTKPTSQDLANTLQRCSEDEYIRVVAHWLASNPDWNTPANNTGNPIIDALVSSAAAHIAVSINKQEQPVWTRGNALKSFWHPGPEGLFAWSLAHTPGAFKVHGIIVDRESLKCI
jgi:hypothetical protein